MLRSITLAIVLKKAGKKYSSGFLRSFYLASLTLGYLCNSYSTAYAANNISEKENAIHRSIRVELQVLLISG